MHDVGSIATNDLSMYLQRRNENRRRHHKEWKQKTSDYYNNGSMFEDGNDFQIFTVPNGVESTMSRTNAMLNSLLSPPTFMHRTNALLSGAFMPQDAPLSRTEMMLQQAHRGFGGPINGGVSQIMLHRQAAPPLSRTEMLLQQNHGSMSHGPNSIHPNQTNAMFHHSTNSTNSTFRGNWNPNTNANVVSISTNHLANAHRFVPSSDVNRIHNPNEGQGAKPPPAPPVVNKMKPTDLFAMLKASGMLPAK